jgi:tetratricopeptide (TPR) repeat protein
MQEVLHDGLIPSQQQQWLDRTVNGLNATFPSPEFENWAVCARLVEQVQAIDRQQATATLDLAHLLEATGIFLNDQGRYGEAEPLFQQALEICRSQLGEDHPNTASSLNNLAGLYKSQGRYGEAEPLYQQALEIRRSQLGDDHHDTASSLNNLAVLYEFQGRYGEAEPFYLQALSIWFNKLGENNPSTKTGRQNFVCFVQKVMAAGRTSELSDHPLTQELVTRLHES